MKAIEAVEVARIGRQNGNGKGIAIRLALKVARTQSRKFIAVGRNEETARKHLVTQKAVLCRKRSVWILKNFSEGRVETNESAGRRVKSKLVVVKQNIEARRYESHKNQVLSRRR